MAWAEIAKIVAEVAKEGAKETAKETARQTAKEAGKNAKTLDTRKPMDSVGPKSENIKPLDNIKDPINLDKRIPKDTFNVEKSFAETLKDYFNELKHFSECPDALPGKMFDKIEYVSPEVVKQKHLEFKRNKNSLIQQWEKITGKEWPRYTEDVYIENKNGEKIKIRNKGDYYDAHHIKPLSLGGTNTAENITPMRAENHFDSRGVHRSDGPCSKMQEMVKGQQ